MPVKRRQFINPGGIPLEDGRSSSAPAFSADRGDEYSGRSSSWNPVPSATTPRGTPRRFAPPRSLSNDAAAKKRSLDNIEPQIRVLRRECLTVLIAHRFHVWMEFLELCRHAKNAKRKRLITHCIGVLNAHSAYSIGKLYFRKLHAWVSHQAVRRHQHRILLSIRRAALKNLVLRYFSQWCKLCTVAQQRQISAGLSRRTKIAHLRVAWNRWHSLQRSCRRLRTVVQPALLRLQQHSVRALLHSTFRRWESFAVRRALSVHLMQTTSDRQLAYWFRRWVRCRFRSSQLQEVQRCMRRNLRLFAKGRLRLWMRWSVSRSVANTIEQRNLQAIAASYLAKWRRLCLCTAQVSHLRSRVSEWRLRRFFSIWVSWVRRSIRSILLEQRHFVCLLQRYYIEWKVHGTTRRLSYQSMRSFSQALKRHGSQPRDDRDSDAGARTRGGSLNNERFHVRRIASEPSTTGGRLSTF